MNAWLCIECGSHDIVDSQPASARALEDHLTITGHSGGEYYYGGCLTQRTTVAVEPDDDGHYTHRLAG